MTDAKLFVALMADAELQAQLASYQTLWRWTHGSSLVPRADFHLTLRFLGSADSRAETRLHDWLRLVPLEPFELLLTRPGSFSTGVAWMGPAHSDRLNALHERVNAAASWAGFPLLGAPWTPHVTLARRCSQSVPPALPVRLRWAVDRFVLIRSHRGSYTVLGEWPGARAEPDA